MLSAKVGNLRALTTLHLDFHEGNRIAGYLPPELGNCIHLEELILNGHKKIVGQCLALHAGGMKNVDSPLAGEIPASFANLTKLRILHLDDNQDSTFLMCLR